MRLPHHLDVGGSFRNLKQGRKSSPAGTLCSLFIYTPFKEINNGPQYLNTNKLSFYYVLEEAG